MHVSSSYVSSILDVLKSYDLPRADNFDILELTETCLECPKKQVSAVRINEMFRLGSNDKNDPILGLKSGLNFRVTTFVETGSIFPSCETIAEAVKMYCRYQSLVESIGDCQIVEDQDGIYMRWDTQFDDDCAFRHLTEHFLGVYVSTLRWLGWVHGEDIESVHFKHKTDLPAEIYKDTLKCPVHFESDYNQIKLVAAIIHKPLPTHNPEKLSAICSRLDKILLGTEKQSDFISQTRAAIRVALQDHHLCFAQIAKMMNLTERQLRLRLKQEGMLFRELTDHARMTMFERLSAGKKPLTDIAQALGYNDQSAFNRAFKRWYGIRPSDFCPVKNRAKD